MYRAIIVDDDRWALEDIKKSFDFPSFNFVLQGEYMSAESAFDAIVVQPPELVVSDIRMGSLSGIDLIRKCREKEIGSLFVIVSGYDDINYIQAAFTYNAFYYLLKPFEDAKTRELMQRITLRLNAKTRCQIKEYPQDTFGKAMKYIDEHFTEPLSLELASEALFLNKNYLSDLFSKRLGMTFTQYRNKQRICLAEQMIREGTFNMTDIAYSCGFDSLSRFSKVFKQILGVSPQQFRFKRPSL